MKNDDDDTNVEGSAFSCDQCGKELGDKIHVVEIRGKRTNVKVTFCSLECRDAFENG